MITRLVSAAIVVTIVGASQSVAQSSASVTSYGEGCPEPVTGAFYEDFRSGFDLGGTAIRLTPNAAGGWDVSASAATYIAPTNGLNSGDDQLFRDLALGFPMLWPGYGTVTAVDVDSNGRLGADLLGSDFSETVLELLEDAPLIAPAWDDFNPSVAGDVFFDVSPGMAVVSWDGVPQFGSNDSSSFQVQFHDSGVIDIVWVQVAGDCLVGYSDGLSQIDPGATDLSAALPFTTASTTPFRLAATDPVLGSVLTFTVRGRPGDAVISQLNVGVTRADVPLDVIGAPGCRLLIDYLADVWTGFGALQIQLPTDPAFLGVLLTFQEYTLSPGSNAAGLVSSNGLELILGS